MVKKPALDPRSFQALADEIQAQLGENWRVTCLDTLTIICPRSEGGQDYIHLHRTRAWTRFRLGGSKGPKVVAQGGGHQGPDWKHILLREILAQAHEPTRDAPSSSV